MRGLPFEKWPTLRDLVAVCLKNGHCGLCAEATIFCGLTDQFFIFPPSVVPWRFCTNFLLEANLFMWGAMKTPTFIHSSTSVLWREDLVAFPGVRPVLADVLSRWGVGFSLMTDTSERALSKSAALQSGDERGWPDWRERTTDAMGNSAECA